MATRRKEPEILEFPPENLIPNLPSVHEPIPPVEDYDDVTALNNVLAELGASETGGGFINIFRERTLNGGKKEDEYIGRFEAAEFSNGGLLEGIKAAHGAGTYKISVYHAGGHGLATRKKITIAADPVSINVAPQSSDLSPVISAIKESSDKTLQAILALAQVNQRQPSMREKLEEMKLMREIFGPTQQAQQINPLEAMKLGMEMAAMGGGDSNNMWVSKMIETFGGPMMDMIAANAGKPAAPRSVNPTLPVPVQHATTSALPTPTPETAQSNEVETVNALITQYLNFLRRAAQQGAPVEEYADSILNSVPPSEHAEIEKYLRPDNWREELSKHTNVVEQFPDWFTRLRNTLIAFIDEDRQNQDGGLPISENPDIPVSHENANASIATDGHSPGTTS